MKLVSMTTLRLASRSIRATCPIVAIAPSRDQGKVGGTARQGANASCNFRVWSCHRSMQKLIPHEQDLSRENNTLEKLSSHPAMARYLAWRRPRFGE